MDKVRQLHNGFSIPPPGNENLFSKKCRHPQTFSVKQMKYALLREERLRIAISLPASGWGSGTKLV
jgi:hypothetical protein